MSATQKERHEFMEKITEHCPKLKELPFDERWKELNLLLRRAAAYKTIQEQGCNDEISEKRTAQVKIREENLEKNMTKFLATVDARPIFQGDPRGYTVKIVCPDGYIDDWGHTGLCVPTS